MMTLVRSFAILATLSILASCDGKKDNPYISWRTYRGDDGINAYSQLDQINRENVKRLEVAWTYRTGDNSEFSGQECNPIIIDTILYAASPKMKIFALHAATGKEIWTYDTYDPAGKERGFTRGLTYWQHGDEKRLFYAAGYRLIALDASTGKNIKSFGEDGFVDLRKGLRDDADIESYRVGFNSPGVVFQDLLIIGSNTGESYDAAPGPIRAYDVRTGALRWTFHTMPQPGEFGYETWPPDSYLKLGGCNAWAGLSIDRGRGIVFASTGAPGFDFHGGERKGQNLFANCVLALDAATGKRIWHFQTSHHDIWDYDLPTPPNLVTIHKDGKDVDVVIQLTKQGLVFILDRESGEPIYPVEERPVAQSTVSGEETWPTQPFPLKPVPLVRTKYDTTLIPTLSPESHDYIANESKKYTWGDLYYPPTLEGIIQLPGLRGGAEWSGGAVDIKTGVMYLGLNDSPNLVQLVKKDPASADVVGKPMIEAGRTFYKIQCQACHGRDLQGNASFPPLVDLDKRLAPDDVSRLLQEGRALMPSFASVPEAQRDAIVSYLFDLGEDEIYKGTEPVAMQADTVQRYGVAGYTVFVDQNDYHAIKPPWGWLCALDLNTAEIVWKVPYGEFPELAARGIQNSGTQLFGGGVVTAGGLIFIGASQDEMFRAVDKSNGKILWQYKLPAGGYATPAVYEVDGREYIVIAAGGGGLQLTKASDHFIAFALGE